MSYGIDELAGAVAWWLNHPWRAVGLYMLTLLCREIALGIFRGMYQVRAARREET